MRPEIKRLIDEAWQRRPVIKPPAAPAPHKEREVETVNRANPMPMGRKYSWTAQDEINYLSGLLLVESVAPNGGRHHITGRQAFAVSAWLILTDRRRFDAKVDAWEVKRWIRVILNADPGLGELPPAVKALWGVEVHVRKVEAEKAAGDGDGN